MNEAFLGRVRASDNGETFLRPTKTDLENLSLDLGALRDEPLKKSLLSG